MASAPTPPPPLLPVTNAAAAGSSPAAGVGSDAPIATPALRLFLSRLSDSVRRSLSDRRPWTELMDRSAFSRPDSLSDATSRLRRNLACFRSQLRRRGGIRARGVPPGAPVLAAHPPGSPHRFSDRETLLGLVVASFVAFFFTSVASLIISGLLVGGAIVAAHGAFRMPEDLFLDDTDAASGNSAAQVAVAADCECNPGEEDHDKGKSQTLKIIAIFCILLASSTGCAIPTLGRRFPVLGPDTVLFLALKAFAAGVILATAFVHILPESFEKLTSPCLVDGPWQKFPFTGLVAMLASIATLLVDTLATGYFQRLQTSGRATAVVGYVESQDDHERGHAHGVSTVVVASAAVDVQRRRRRLRRP
ncbi:hypothetical protein GUJ93_ZPchr0005g15308 [Zizania palustris]|uniref:Uncharacterized protein n=1 Tax=Zizania palustris TaxID=103762 RepID=A0A8J5VHY3_ZIZPA|nr:hypothetical protein GUJ93_ZPchr0005g15308 [Zizania palustris]